MATGLPNKKYRTCCWQVPLLVCLFVAPSLSGRDSEPLPQDMVYIAAGPFTRGIDDPRASADERPARQVYVSAFYLGKFEVTHAQFKAFVEATGYLSTAEEDGAVEKQDGINWRHPEGPRAEIAARPDHPVVHVSWYDAQAYCSWKGKRLPTEAEWEKGARGEDGRLWPWGNAYDRSRANAWGGEDGYPKTAPAGTFPRGVSPAGALDMAGNVWEWCADWYDPDYYTTGPDQDPQGPEGGVHKVLRGGSWINPWSVLRSTNRFQVMPADRSPYIGFRCARSE